MLTVQNKDQKKRFIIYTRCSTDDQAQGDFTTLDAQAFHCKNMLEAFGYELSTFGKTGIIIDDGYSGKDLNRPGIKSILHGVEGKRTFDGIIFFRLDRLTRNPRDLYAMIDLFREKNIDFVSVRENLDSSTAIGRVVIGILGLLSAFERELTGERVKASALARVKQGIWVGGTVPYGYMLVDDGPRLPNDKQPHKIVVDEAVAKHLKIVWEMAAENKPLSEIANALLLRGIKGPSGKIWSKQTLDAIVKNQFYKGNIKYAGECYKGRHTPLVSDELWELANQRLVKRMPGHYFIPRQREYVYLLSGLLRCGECGSYYIACTCAGQSGQRYFYYNCGRAKQKMGCTNKGGVNAKQIDRAVLDFFRKASADRTLIARAIGKALIDAKERHDEADKAYRASHAELCAARAEGQRLVNLTLKGDIPEGTSYKARLAELEAQIGELEKKTAELEEEKSAYALTAYAGEYITANIEYALEHLHQASPETQRELMRSIVKEIFLFKDKIEISLFLFDLKQDYCKMPAGNAENGENGGFGESEKSGNPDKKITPRIDGGLDSCGGLLASRKRWLPKQDTKQTAYTTVSLPLFKQGKFDEKLSVGFPLPPALTRLGPCYTTISVPNSKPTYTANHFNR